MKKTKIPSFRQEYTCAMCGGKFNTGWSDVEAMKEYIALFGKAALDEQMKVVCDDCFKKVITSLPKFNEEKK